VSWRPSDWEPLAEKDPVPGDPAEVRQLSRELKDIAQTIKDQTEKLRTMCSDDYWDADAAKKFDHTAQDRAAELGKVYDRYHAAATALDGYVPTLEDQQAVSLTLRTQAQDLRDARDSAQKRLDHDDAQPDDADPRPGHDLDAQTVGDYWSELRELQRKAAECASAVHQAARTAADKLDHVIHHDGLKDGWTDHVRQWVHEAAGWISKIAYIAGLVATICGVLALLVGWIPVIGQALAAVLGAVALLATLVSLVCHLALLWSGDGGVLDVVLDVVGVLTFGVGRAATSGIRAAVTGLRASGKMGTAAEAVIPLIRSKGGVEGVKVVTALTHGDLATASQLSGIRKSLLKGWMGNEIGKLGQFGPGGVKAMTRVMESGPGRFLPRGADFADAFKVSSYVDVVKDGVTGFRSLVHDAPSVASHVRLGAGTLVHDPGAALSQLGHGVAQHLSLTPEVAAELKHTQQLVHGMNNEVVHAADHVLHTQLTFNVAQWGAFTGVDLADKLHLLEGVPDAGLNGIGQGERIR
jgi:hypothetical protein